MSDSFTINDDSVQTDNSSNLSFMEIFFLFRANSRRFAVQWPIYSDT